MSGASYIINLLRAVTDAQIDALAPVDRRLLQDQLERVHRMVTGTARTSGAGSSSTPEGGEPKRSRAAFFEELRDGRGRD